MADHIKISKKKIRIIAVIVIAVVLLVVGIVAGFSIRNKLAPPPVADTKPTSTSVTNITINPIAVVESFKIVSLELYYNDIIDNKTKKGRKLFGLIPGLLEDAEKRLIVQTSGKVFMGIDVKNHPIRVAEKSDGSQKVLELTIPKAEIISHEQYKPSVLIDDADHTENYTSEEFVNLQDEAKLSVNEKIDNGEFDNIIARAQESAKAQLESFLNSIPDIRDNYRLEFVLEE